MFYEPGSGLKNYLRGYNQGKVCVSFGGDVIPNSNSSSGLYTGETYVKFIIEPELEN